MPGDTLTMDVLLEGIKLLKQQKLSDEEYRALEKQEQEEDSINAEDFLAQRQ